MKRWIGIILVLVTSISLTACFDSDKRTVAGIVKKKYRNFTIDVPSTWRQVLKENFANTIPTETVALLLNRVEGDDFIQNVNVVKESLNTDAGSLEYAKANVLLGSKALLDYRPFSSEELNLNGIRTVLHLFNARNVSSAPLRRYVQSYFTRDKVGYTVTCVSKVSDAEQQIVCNNIVKSFRFR